MANLVVDIGNSVVKMAVIEGDTVAERILDDTPLFKQGRAFAERYAALPSIISSVRADGDDLTQYIRQLMPSALFLAHDTPLPISISYATPETLGRDRIALAVAAAAYKPGQNVLVVDAGTAITYDVVTKAGEYIGGNISPGIAIRFKALNAFTGRLPLCKMPAEPYPDLGRNTRDAIVAGVLNGVLYEVQATINAIGKMFPDMAVFLTGGDVGFLAKNLTTPVFVDFNLTLLGLNVILDFNLKLEQRFRKKRTEK